MVTKIDASMFDAQGKEIILDADADTSITADTDDQIDIRIAGADDFQFTANTFTAQSGSTIAAQALTGTTGVFSSDVTGLTLNATGDTAASDNAAIGYTSAEGLILTGQGSTDDITIKNDADTTIVNVATGGTDVEISAGNIFFGTGSKGIYLGVTSATAANLLDDYEEGQYTPTFAASNSGSYTLDTDYDIFSYTKIGRMVHIVGRCNVASESSPSGMLYVSLPFTPVQLDYYAEAGYHNGLLLDNYGDGGASTNVIGWTEGANTDIQVYDYTHGTGAISGLVESEVDGTWGLSVRFSFLAT